MADRILGDVSHELTGHIGIRRYPGDSYWAPDYDVRLASSDQTRDFSDDLAARDALLERRGEEAQWCIFDPMLSALYGQRYLAGGTSIDREAQAWHFTRAVAQVTTEWRCPELYYLRRGAWVSNPHTPLLWTQANLRLALSGMRATAT
jgi:phosphorylase kinase alpha/beta subunit